MFRVSVGEFRAGKKEKAALNAVIDSGRLSEDRQTFEFEKAWAHYTGNKYAVAINSGTSALIAGLEALKYRFGLKKCSKVVTTPLTFIATINSIVHAGLEPLFVDIDRKTLIITPENIEEAVKKYKDISIILPVHLMGYAADMDAINKIAQEHNLAVMEDAAQAHGTLYNGKMVGSLSDLAVFSFYIAHNIQAGEMGAVTTNDIAIYKFIKKIKAHGRMCECNVCTRHLGVCPPLDKYRGKKDFDPRFYHDLIGFNFKVMEFQASLGLIQLRKADEIFKKRNFNVKYLIAGMEKLSDILQFPVYSNTVSYLGYPIIIKKPRLISRLTLRRELEKRGIETRPLFGSIPTQQPAYSFLKGQYTGKLPNAEYVGNNGFYIGCHQYLKKDDLDFIIYTFKKILE